MTNPVRPRLLRPRLLGAILVTIVLAAVLPFASLSVRLLVGWCLGVIVYVGGRVDSDVIRDFRPSPHSPAR